MDWTDGGRNRKWKHTANRATVHVEAEAGRQMSGYIAACAASPHSKEVVGVILSPLSFLSARSLCICLRELLIGNSNSSSLCSLSGAL